MSASLVGSEMCIRDRYMALAHVIQTCLEGAGDECEIWYSRTLVLKGTCVAHPLLKHDNATAYRIECKT
eukprot:4323051-Alexandrium_andersonii.AAC.1